jgi:hypothetical protein
MNAMTESAIRDLLIRELAQSPAGEGAAFISEMFLADYSRRADLIMANGKLSVFEIKSPLDNLDRLEGQLENYLQYFEQVTIVCATKHEQSVLAKVPNTVGVWTISECGNISVRQRAKVLKIARKDVWLSFLPVSEIKLLLKAHSIAVSGTREQLIDSASALDISLIRSYVLQCLKKREERIAALKEKRTRSAGQLQIDQQSHAKRLAIFIEQQQPMAPLKAIPRRIR